MVQEHFHVSSTSITTNVRSVALLHLAGQFTVHEWLVMSAYLVTISLAMVGTPWIVWSSAKQMFAEDTEEDKEKLKILA